MTEYETVTVKASLDAQGNGAFPSDTNIITHDGIPLRDYLITENEHTLKKPEGLNENGTIIVPENTDARTLKEDGVYYCYQWLPESVPENSHALAIRVVNSKNGSRALYADLTASPLVYRAFVSGEVFYDWKLIAGEVPLWSGSVQDFGSDITLSKDLNAFGNLRAVVGGVNLLASNNSIVNNTICFSSMFHYWNNTSSIIREAAFTVKDSKNLFLYSDSGQVNFNYTANASFTKIPVTAIYGRP